MGLPGVFSAANVLEVASPVVTVPPGTVRSATAHCPDATGDIALSGGWGGGSSPTTPDNGVTFNAPVPGDAHAWQVDMENFSSADTTLQAFVICGVPGH